MLTTTRMMTLPWTELIAQSAELFFDFGCQSWSLKYAIFVPSIIFFGLAICSRDIRYLSMWTAKIPQARHCKCVWISSILDVCRWTSLQTLVNAQIVHSGPNSIATEPRNLHSLCSGLSVFQPIFPTAVVIMPLSGVKVWPSKEALDEKFPGVIVIDWLGVTTQRLCARLCTDFYLHPWSAMIYCKSTKKLLPCRATSHRLFQFQTELEMKLLRSLDWQIIFWNDTG